MWNKPVFPRISNNYSYGFPPLSESILLNSFISQNGIKQSSIYLWFIRKIAWVPRPKKGCILLTEAQNKSGQRKCSQTQFRGMVAWCWDAEYSSRGGNLAGPLLLPGVWAAPVNSLLKNKHWMLFLLFTSSMKVNILSGFLWVRGKRYSCGSFLKAKKCNTNFQKVGDMTRMYSIWGLASFIQRCLRGSCMLFMHLYLVSFCFCVLFRCVDAP